MSELPSKPYSENRPWGGFIKFVENALCSVKILTVNEGQSLSLQFHKSRDEFWRIISGSGKVTIGKDQLEIASGKEYFIPRQTLHRIEAGGEKVVLLEISYGFFDENDIVRIEDKYNRAK